MEHFRPVLRRSVDDSWKDLFAAPVVTVILLAAVWATNLLLQYGKKGFMTNALTSGVGWSLLSTIIVFLGLFVVHFCYITPKRMLAEAVKNLELANDQYDRDTRKIREEKDAEIYALQKHVEELEQKSPPVLSHEERTALYVKIRDLINESKSASSPTGIYEIGALVRFWNEFRHEDDVVWVCAKLKEQGFQDPFKLLETRCPGFFDGGRLDFLRDARGASFDINNMASAGSFVTTCWRRRDEYKEACFYTPINATIERLTFYDAKGVSDQKPYLLMSVLVVLENPGPPSAVKGWPLTTASPSLTVDRLKASGRTQDKNVSAEIILKKKDSLIEKVDNTPIQTGTRVRGWLDYYLEGRSLSEILGQELKIEIAFQDVLGREGVAKFVTMVKQGEAPAAYFPGLD